MTGPEDERIADDGEPAPPDANPARPARRNIWPWVLLGVLASFTIGVLGSPWLESTIRGHLPLSAPIPAQTAEDSRFDAPDAPDTLDALDARLRRLETAPAAAIPGGEAELLARLEALEARAQSEGEAEAGVLANLQQLAAELQRARQAIDAGDAQVRDLFLLSLVRRMMAAGRPLDAVEPLLLERFRGRDAAAIEALAAWSRAPQTRETLAGRLPGLEEGDANEAGADGNWWQRLKAGLGRLVRVHDASGPEGLAPAERLAAAEVALRRNDLDLAIRRVEELPRSAMARQWARDARLLATAERALDRLDTAVLTAALATIARETAATAD